MKNILGIFLILLLVFLVVKFSPVRDGKVYDCGISEISPDYPLKVKEECRKLRSGTK
jgi:hypothetical protein